MGVRFGQPNTADYDVSGMSSRDMLRLEREIAAKHLGKFPWGSLLWGALNLLVWLSLWPAVLVFGLSPFVAFPVAVANVALCYLPSHEAQHSIYAKPGERLRWLNELVGHLSTIPLAIPYSALKATHMEHHKHCNDPELDPDYGIHCDTTLQVFRRALRLRDPRGGMSERYRDTLKRIGREDAARDHAAFEVIHFGILFALALSGFAVEAALLWWLPRQLGAFYILYYLSWAPHNPQLQKGRYKDTRASKSWGGNISSLGMQAHIVHHLYPRIPLFRTPAAYREMRPLLEARGATLHDH